MVKNVVVRDISIIADKWASVTPLRTTEYQRGVQSPKRDWENETLKASSRYFQGLGTARIQDRFVKGVRSRTTEFWKNRTIDFGADRWSPGVQAATEDYRVGFAPFRDTISRLTLPERFPTGDPRNIERVKAVAIALHVKKETLSFGV